MTRHPNKRFLLIHWMKWVVVVGLMGLQAIFAPPLIHAQKTSKTLYFLNLSNTAVGIHARDTQLAFQVVMSKVIRTRYPEYGIIVDFPKDTAAAEKAIEEQHGHVMIINSLDFLDMQRKLTLIPLHILSKADRPTESYLLIMAAGQNIETLAKQRGRSLIIEKGGSGEIALAWLAIWLEQQGIGPVESFFSEVRIADKPSRAILPVFFGQASACVVAESAFTVMAELNPQIKRKITILDRSPGFVNLIVCATKQLEPIDKQHVFEEGMAINESADGQQVLTIIQMRRIFKFDMEKFAATRALYQKYHQLIKKDG